MPPQKLVVAAVEVTKPLPLLFPKPPAALEVTKPLLLLLLVLLAKPLVFEVAAADIRLGWLWPLPDDLGCTT